MASSAAVSSPSSKPWTIKLPGVTAFCSYSLIINLLQLLVVAAIVLQVMKMTHKGASHAGGGYTASLKNIFHQYGPEICGLAGCAALAIIIQTHGSMATVSSAVQEKVVRDLYQEWPILLTADSLLEFQSMLRVVVLVSSVLRRGNGATLLAQEVAALLCAAALGRTVLLARNRSYMLDGPLGGALPAACDLLTVPLLAVLAYRINKGALTASAFVLVVAAYVGSQNRLSLAGDPFADGLFIFVHIAELFAALAYLSRAVLSDVEVAFAGRPNVALRFAHIMMPIQAFLSAYYFVEITNLAQNRVNVAAGYPSEILRVGGMAQAMAYTIAAVLHFGQYRESPKGEGLATQLASGAATKEEYLFTDSPDGL